MSKNPLAWKLGLILAVVAVATFFGFPLSERINLGLDLRGGAHILLQVDTAAALKYQMDQVQDQIGQRLKEKGLTYASIVPVGVGTTEVRGTDPARRSEVREVFDTVVQGWDITNPSDGDFRLSMPAEQRTYYEKSATDTTLTILRNRIDALGVGEQLIQEQGVKGDRILLQLPGVEDPGRIKDIIKDPAVLEWKAVTYPPGVGDPGAWTPPDTREALAALFGGRIPDDTEVFPQVFRREDGTAATTVFWPLKRVSTVSGNDLRNAYRSNDEWGSPAVSFVLTQEAGKRFSVATRENVGRKMAIVLGSVASKEVLSAPVIQSEIHDQGIIQGGFSLEEAENLSLKLRTGAIPADIRIIEERTVGPSLGLDSIRKGLVSGIAGFLGVMLFMVVYYRLAGVNAVVALGLNVILVFGTLGALPFLFSGVTELRATLTLPGIAGLILTVGMAVDSNVLVFERIREELRLGKTVRSAVEQGFSKAFMTILDCHVTTVVSAAFLGLYGTGAVRGFAVTLIIGLVASMFTSVFVSRQLFELVLSRKTPVESLSI